MLGRVENFETQISSLEMQVPPNSEHMPSFGFNKEIPVSQNFSTVNLDNGPEIQRKTIPTSFPKGVRAAYLNAMSGQSGRAMQFGRRIQSSSKRGTPCFGSVSSNIGGSVM